MISPRRAIRWLALNLIRAVNHIQTRKIVVRFASGEEEIRKVWQLNFDTYHKELGQDEVTSAVSASGVLPDEFQDNSKYVIAILDGEIIGMSILTLPSGSFSMESSPVNLSLLDGIRDHTLEYRRLAVRREQRGKGVFLRMADFSMSWGIPRGYRHAIVAALGSQIRSYSRISYRVFDRPFVKGGCTYHPMIASLDDFASPGVEKAKFPMAEARIRDLGK